MTIRSLLCAGVVGLVALAAFVGRARLIDNVTISVRGEAATVDLGRIAAPAAEER